MAMAMAVVVMMKAMNIGGELVKVMVGIFSYLWKERVETAKIEKRVLMMEFWS
jgi:aspartate aminotransferase-like enzyme